MKKILFIIAALAFGVSAFSQALLENITNRADDLIQVLYYTSRNGIGGNGHLVILFDGAPIVQDFEPADMLRPYGIAVDTAHLKVYITDYYYGAIYRFDADGKNPLKILDATVPGQEMAANAEAIFVLGDKIYWGGIGGVYRANLDGANPEVFISTGGAPPEYPIDMQYDPANNKIYLVNDKSDYSGGYWSVNMDGTGLTEIIPDVDGTALEMDFRSGKAYLVFYGAAGTVVTENGVYMCNLDGTSLTRIGDYGVKATWGITLDQTRDKLFWGVKNSNWAPDGKIIRANLDGSGQEDWITGISPHAMQVATINLNPVNIPGNGLTQIRVYPNPATDQLIINGDFTNARLVLSSADGRMVYSAENQSQRAYVNVSAFKSGFYILRIETTKGVITRKITLIAML
ncbi:MAG: T9SS type A sorting domain-containing protein [Bacteroidetes bacterium]|nr:T9SS type A sorting domain-containing protein [Bacteroidota bacterium]